MGVLQVSREVGGKKSPGPLTICDRYILSTLVYHEAMGLYPIDLLTE